MYKFSDIGQFRNTIRAVKLHHDYQGKDVNGEPIYQHVSPYPTITFTGTVKLHGTNAGIVFDGGKIVSIQSRQRVIDVEHDNAGFAFFVSGLSQKIIDDLVMVYGLGKFVVYGEWCGIEPS